MKTSVKHYISITGNCDSAGRAPFSMFWLDVDGLRRPEPSSTDGEPIGYRRAQCFRAVPEDYVAQGAILADTELDAERLGHALGSLVARVAGQLAADPSVVPRGASSALIRRDP